MAAPGIWDTQCRFKAFRSEAAGPIFSRIAVDGWGFDIEISALSRAMRYKVWILGPETIWHPERIDPVSPRLSQYSFLSSRP